MAYLQINSRQAAAFAVIAKMPLADFKALAAAVIGHKHRTIRSSVLLSEVERLSNDKTFAEALCSQLLGLATLRRDKNISVVDAVEAVKQGMLRFDRSEVTQSAISWFDEAKSAFAEMLGSDMVVLSAKARSLSIDFEHLYSTANVVTDVRPIFDDGRGVIQGALVVQALSLHFFDNRDRSGEGQITLALDVNDMNSLISELQAGLRKAEAAKRQFVSTFGENIYIIGEDT